MSTSGCPLWSTTSRLTTRPGLQSRGAWSAQWEWQCLDTGSHRPGADQGQEHPGRGGGAHGEQRTQHLGLLDGVSNEDVVTGDRQGASPECCYTIKFNSSSSFSFSDHHSNTVVTPPESTVTEPFSLTVGQCEEMASSFVRWYYHLLNTQVDTDTPDWSSSHFWPDASARVSLLNQAGEVQENIEVMNNSEEVSRMLVNVFRDHKLKCNPNLCEEGVRGRLSPHGLVMVLACGTLHNQDRVCGVFEQVGHQLT